MGPKVAFASVSVVAFVTFIHRSLDVVVLLITIFPIYAHISCIGDYVGIVV